MNVSLRNSVRAALAAIVLSGALSAGVSVAPARADGLAGPYLAAVQANFRNDFAEAAKYYSQALKEDPQNPFLLQNAVINNVIIGDFAAAIPLAETLRELSPDAQLAGLVLVADALQGNDFAAAAEVMGDAELQLNPLMSALLQGWIAAGQGDVSGASEHFSQLGRDTNFGAMGEYHEALVLALAGNFDGALAIMEGEGEAPLRVNRASIVAHVQILMQLDRRADALAVLDTGIAERPAQELIDLKARIAEGAEIPFDYVRSPLDGTSEVFLTLATALTQEDAVRFAILYARLAQYIRPDYEDAHLLTADLLVGQEQYDLAIDEYARIPRQSPMYRTAQIGRADALADGGQADEAIAVLTEISEAYPEDRFVHIARGDRLRQEERYEEAAQAYTDALALQDAFSAGDWRTYYVRGIAYERLDWWDQAEADFRKSLDLSPDQPLVLNYLGYSLVEKRMKIDEAKDMIERAVAARPNDGYITDSLGWVLYRLGDFEGAVPHMERAAELLPTDPIINDHLGDVYWMVGRKVEAEFQWRRALSFEPEEADAERIRAKLERGLDAVLAEEGETPARE